MALRRALVIVLLICAFGCDRTSGSPVRSDPGPPAGTGGKTGKQEKLPAESDVDLPPAGEDPSLSPSGVSKVGLFAPDPDARAEDVLLKLRRAVHRKGGRVHGALIDLQRGAVLASHRVDEPVNPASNMKVLTAAAALDLLGPGRSFRTELFGDIDEAGASKRLVLRGGGDPGLTTADLGRLARAVWTRGSLQVSEIACDQSRFDAAFVPPAFEQQPGEWAPFRAPISALAVDKNSVSLNVLAGSEGESARIWYEPPGVVVSSGKVMTGAQKSGDRVTWRLDPESDPKRPTSVVGGRLAAELGRRMYSRRLEDPRLSGCYAFAELLGELGVQGARAVTSFEKEQKKGPRLTYVSSAPLSELLKPLGKESDNFTAEMILVALSQADDQEQTVPWSSARGAARLVSWLDAGGVPTRGLRIRNGSGLFDANRLTAESLALTLARMEGRSEVFAEFLSQLSIYGTDGTLRRRKRDHPERSRVRAKTGTLRNIDALSGYILRGAGQRPIVFSLIVEDAKGGHAATRRLLDDAVFSWLEQLAPAPAPEPLPPRNAATSRAAESTASGTGAEAAP